MLRFDLCDFNDAYIVFKGIVNASADKRDRDEMNGQVTFFLHFKNKWCISLECRRLRHFNVKLQFA